MAENTMPTCDKPVGRKPYWMGADQWEYERCVCLREPGHKPPCKCEHNIGSPDDEEPRG